MNRILYNKIFRLTCLAVVSVFICFSCSDATDFTNTVDSNQLAKTRSTGTSTITIGITDKKLI